MNRLMLVTLLVLRVLIPCKAYSQSKHDTTFLDKVQKILEIRRSFEIESQAKNPALLSYKKSDNSNAVVTVDLAVSYLGWEFIDWKLKPFVQIDFSGSSAKDKNELLTTGLSFTFFPVNKPADKLKLQPDLFYTRDFFNKQNIYRAALTLTPEIRDSFIPLADITKRKFSEESIDGNLIYALNPGISLKAKETDYDSDQENTTEYFASLRCDLAVRHWYLQFVASGLGEQAFGYEGELRYQFGATATLFFDEKERSSLNAKFEQKGSDVASALKTFTLGFGLKL